VAAIEQVPGPRTDWKARVLKRWRPALALAILGALAIPAAYYSWGWWHWFAGLNALERYHNEAAQEHLQVCRRVWPDSLPITLLLARAARRQGEFAAADQYLRTCEQRGPSATDEVVLERALLRAAGGDLPEQVEEYLLSRAEHDPFAAPLVWEALAAGYTRVYRVLEALACLDRWQARDPENTQAHLLRGNTWRHIKQLPKAAPEYERVVELDPEQSEARYWLAVAQLDMGRYADARGHLDYLCKHGMTRPDVLIYQARCDKGLGQFSQARKTLDTVLAQDPQNSMALRARGELELAAGLPDAAESWLRKAAEVSPHDYLTQWLLYQSLVQQNKTAQANAQQRRVDDLKERLERLNTITATEMSKRPHDPVLHQEIGDLLSRLGQPELAEVWWLSALRKDPSYAPAHRALAEHYRLRGDTEQAEYHRRQCAAGSETG
jgi:tetratricopeptide (TPR) repeat protein